MAGGQKTLGLKPCHLAPEPHLCPVGSSLKLFPKHSLSSERLKPPLIGFVDFLVTNAFPAVLIENLAVVNFFCFFFTSLMWSDSEIVFKDPHCGLTPISKHLALESTGFSSSASGALEQKACVCLLVWTQNGVETLSS